MTQSVLGKIEELSEERERLLEREGAHRAGDAVHRRLEQIDHDLQVLWDLRRRELSGETIDLDDDFFDRFTVDPGTDAPGR
jgi:predicted nuclease with TOPRIM domain